MRIDYTNNTLIVLLYDDSNLKTLLNSISEIERYLHRQLSVDFASTKEIFIDVDDYFDYLAIRKLVLDFCPIY